MRSWLKELLEYDNSCMTQKRESVIQVKVTGKWLAKSAGLGMYQPHGRAAEWEFERGFM